jgi:choice-of-anchor A domain-containing protein
MKRALLCLSLSIGFVLPALSSASLLGPADPYNVFLFDDMVSNNSDTEGRIAAGGDVHLQNYSVGLKSSAAEYSLVTGGKTRFWSGAVQNGGVYSNGDVITSNASIFGNLVSNSSITRYNGTVTGISTPNAGAASPVDFASAYQTLSQTSKSLSQRADTGSKTVYSWGTIDLNGGDGLNIFSLTSAELANSTGLRFNLGENGVAVINVSGSYNDFSGFGFFDFNDLTGRYERMAVEMGRDILFNFYETNNMDIGSIGVIGSILAPEASLYFNSGVINGTVVANTMNGTGQFNLNPFAYSVPAPQTFALLGIGLVMMFGRRRQQA